MEPILIVILLLVVMFAAYIFGNRMGRMQIMDYLSGKDGDWDGKRSRRLMLTTIYESICSTYREDNGPTWIGTFFDESIVAILTTEKVKWLTPEQLKLIFNGSVDEIMGNSRYRDLFSPDKETVS